MTTDVWLALGMTLATLVLLVIPGIMYADYVLASWIGDSDSYEDVIAAVESVDQPPPSSGVDVNSGDAELAA